MRPRAAACSSSKEWRPAGASRRTTPARWCGSSSMRKVPIGMPRPRKWHSSSVPGWRALWQIQLSPRLGRLARWLRGERRPSLPSTLEVAASHSLFPVLEPIGQGQAWWTDREIVSAVSASDRSRSPAKVHGLRTLYRSRDGARLVVVGQHLAPQEQEAAARDRSHADDGEAREVLWRARHRGASPSPRGSTLASACVAGEKVEVLRTSFLSDPNLQEAAFRWRTTDVTVTGWGFTAGELTEMVATLAPTVVRNERWGEAPPRA